MCKRCDKAIADTEWWEPFVPLSHETPKQYLSRATHFDDYGMNFVMMKIDRAKDLVTVGDAFGILAVRHQYEPGQYAVQVLRDLVFLAYTQEFENLVEGSL
jgi:hypothetical protein